MLLTHQPPSALRAPVRATTLVEEVTHPWTGEGSQKHVTSGKIEGRFTTRVVIGTFHFA